MKTSTPYGPGMSAKKTPETMTAERGKNEGKAKARYPHKPITNRPGGEGKAGR